MSTMNFETTVLTLFLAALCCESILVEYVEVFDTKESMGMKLSNNLAVIGFGSSGKGIISVAEAKGTIRPGDVVVSLNDKSVASSSLREFVTLLKGSKLPRKITFRGERTQKDIEDAQSFFKRLDNPAQHHPEKEEASMNEEDTSLGKSPLLKKVYRVSFSGAGLIGLQFAGDANSTVMGFSRSATNEMREAEKKKTIEVGDVLLSVNGVEVDTKKLRDILAIVEESRSPRVLTFARPERGDGSHGGRVRVGSNGGQSYTISDFEHIEISALEFPEDGKMYRVLRATFGTLAPCNRLPIVLANPTNGCASLVNAGQISGIYVAMTRGHCSFTTKARIAQDNGAAGLVVINGPSTIVSLFMPLHFPISLQFFLGTPPD